MDVVGLARGRIHTIPPWLDQEEHKEKYRVANEALAMHFLAKAWH